LRTFASSGERYYYNGKRKKGKDGGRKKEIIGCAAPWQSLIPSSLQETLGGKGKGSEGKKRRHRGVASCRPHVISMQKGD